MSGLDDLVDQHWPRLGPCLICGVPGQDQRHRVMDAVASRVQAGEDPETIADDHGITLTALAVAYLDYDPEGDRELVSLHYFIDEPSHLVSFLPASKYRVIATGDCVDDGWYVLAKAADGSFT